MERRDGKVYVTVNGQVEEYDKIIVTAPLYIPNKRADGQVGMVDYFDARMGRPYPTTTTGRAAY